MKFPTKTYYKDLKPERHILSPTSSSSSSSSSLISIQTLTLLVASDILTGGCLKNATMACKIMTRKKRENVGILQGSRKFLCVSGASY